MPIAQKLIDAGQLLGHGAPLLPAGYLKQEAGACVANCQINYGLCSQALQGWVVEL